MGMAFLFTVMAAASLDQALLGAMPGRETDIPPAFSPVAWGFMVAVAVATWALFVIVSIRQPPAPLIEVTRPD
jgi:hypothetical protein